jgi:hypothetical protein
MSVEPDQSEDRPRDSHSQPESSGEDGRNAANLPADGSREQYLQRLAGQIGSLAAHRSETSQAEELQLVLNNVPTYIPEKEAIVFEGVILVVLRAPWQMAEERIEAIQAALQSHTEHALEVQWIHDPSIEPVNGKSSTADTDRSSARSAHGHGNGRSPASDKFFREVERTAPEGVDVIKASLYSAPLGGGRLNFSTLKVHVEPERSDDLASWVRQIEEKYNIGVLTQPVEGDRSLQNSLLEIADVDGIVRDASLVKELMNGIHGVVLPSAPGSCGVARPPQNFIDLTDEEAIALDPFGARDLDDILFAEEPSHSGIIRVRASFVDGAWQIRPNSEMDLYARMAGQSVYIRNTNLSLFGDLSFNELSLLEGEERFAFTVEMDVARDGRRLHYDVFRSKVKNHHSLDYSLAQGILEGVNHPAQEHLRRLVNPVAALRADRMETGGILHLDRGSSLTASVNSHMIVEELMIAARRSIAEFSRANDIPILNKIHVQPGREVRRELLRELRAAGVKAHMSRELTRPLDFRRMLGELDERGEHALLYKVLDVYMGRSRFDSSQLGHFGLGVDAYTEIKARHYAGIVVQRQLERFLEGQPPLPYDAIREKQREVNTQRRAVPQKMYTLLQYERLHDALQQRGELFAIQPRHSSSGEVRFQIPEFPWRWAASKDPIPFEYLRGQQQLVGMLDGYDVQAKRLNLTGIRPAI